MLKHEFGIMMDNPIKNKRYDEYEHERYDSISIHDDYIFPLLNLFSEIDCYWHTLDRPEKGLAYYGVTLIPPTSIDSFLKIFLQQDSHVDKLVELMKRAKNENKYIIHFGI